MTGLAASCKNILVSSYKVGELLLSPCMALINISSTVKSFDFKSGQVLAGQSPDY